MGYRYDTTIMDVHKCMAVHTRCITLSSMCCRLLPAHNNENVYL